MNKQEFDIWRTALNAKMNTVEGIGDYSSIGGAVGSHNNKTPDQVRRDNEEKLNLRRKIEEASIREQMQREKLKEDAKKEAKKQIDEDGPAVGLSGVKHELERREAQANKPSLAQKVGNLFKGKDDDRVIGMATFNRKAKEAEEKEAQANKPEPKAEEHVSTPKAPEANKPEATQAQSQPQTHTTPKPIEKAEPKKSLGDKFKEGLKNVAKGAVNAVQKSTAGARMDAQDAKDWIDKNWKKVQKEEAGKRGHSASYYARSFKKPEDKEAKPQEKAEQTTKATNAKSTNNNSGSSRGGAINNTINFYNTGVQHANDERERVAKAEAEKEKFAKEQEEFNAKNVKNAQGKQINKNKVTAPAKATKAKNPLPTIDNEEGKKGLEAEVKKAKNKIAKKTKPVKKDDEVKPEVKAEEKKPVEETPKAEETNTAKEVKPVKAETKEEKKEEVKANADDTEKTPTDDNKDGNEPANAKAPMEKTSKPAKQPKAKTPKAEEVKTAEPNKEEKPEQKEEKEKEPTKEKEEKPEQKEEKEKEPTKEKEEKPVDNKDGKDDIKVVGHNKGDNDEGNGGTPDKRNKPTEPKPNKPTGNDGVKPEAEKKEEVKETPKAEKVEPAKSNKEEKPSLKDMVNTAKSNAPKTPEEKAEVRRRLQAKRDLEAKERWEKRKAEMAGQKAGHEKSDEEIKANNEKIRAERNLPDEKTEDVKKHENTVGASWRQDFTKRANSGDTEGLPDKVKNLMGKYKEYWKKVNAKDFELSKNPEARAEGDKLENELKSVMNEYPEAFGKKTTVKGKAEEDGQSKPKGKIDLSALRNKKKEADKKDVDKFIDDNTKEDEGPSDAELRRIEAQLRKKGK